VNDELHVWQVYVFEILILLYIDRKNLFIIFLGKLSTFTSKKLVNRGLTLLRSNQINSKNMLFYYYLQCFTKISSFVNILVNHETNS